MKVHKTYQGDIIGRFMKAQEFAEFEERYNSARIVAKDLTPPSKRQKAIAADFKKTRNYSRTAKNVKETYGFVVHSVRKVATYHFLESTK